MNKLTFKKNIVFISMLLLLSLGSNAQRLVKKPSRFQKDSLKQEVDAMLTDDQKFRWMIMFGTLDDKEISVYKALDNGAKMKRITNARQNTVGISQSQKDSIGKIQAAIDSVNFVKIYGIINEFGFPYKYIPSYRITTILLHASPRWTTPDFFSLLLDEVKAERLEGIEYARVYDRMQLEKKMDQLYFEYNPGTPKNTDETNRARKEIGLKEYTH